MHTQENEKALEPPIIDGGGGDGDGSGDAPASTLAGESNNSEKKKKEEEKPKPSMKNLFRVLGYGAKQDFLLMGLSALTSIGAGAAMPVMFVVFGSLVGNFTDYFKPNSTVTRHEFQKSVNKNSLYIVYIFIFKFLTSYISMFAIRISGLRISSALRKAYLRALLCQPISLVDTVSPGTISARITTSSNTIQLGISQQFALLFESTSFIIALYIVSFIYSWSLTLVASSAFLFILLCYAATVPTFMKIYKKTEEIQEQASSLAYEIFSSIRIVVAFGAAERLGAQHQGYLSQAKKLGRKNGPNLGFMMAPGTLAMYGAMGLAFWFGIKEYTKGNIKGLNNIVIVLFSVVMAVGIIGRIASPIIGMSKASSVATDLFTTIDAKAPNKSGLKASDVPIDADIVLERVSFTYPSRPDVKVLDELSVRFEAGKVTAIVGPSGSGKSTIVGLLERWYDLSEPLPEKDASANQATSTTTSKSTSKTEDGKGTDTQQATQEPQADEPPKVLGSGLIKVGDIELSKIDAKWWRSQIGLVQQEPFLFNDTIYQNIAYGLCGTQWEEKPKDEKLIMVKEACKEAFADEFIMNFPLGYETIVGEGGIKISGGQRQRLSIARSIIKRPSILILDEATSAIDVRTERLVQRALDEVSKNRTTIVIAHRLSTIKQADKIVVLRQGKLVEQGSHSDLLQIESGVYHGLVHAQDLTMDKEEYIEQSSAEKASGELDAKAVETVTADNIEDTAKPNKYTSSYKERGFFRSFGLLIYEQRRRWISFILIILGAMGAAAVHPLQAYFFAKIFQAFTLPGPEFVRRGNFWALMFFILAIGSGIAYFILLWAGYFASLGISTFYRQQYLESILRKRIAFFDAEGNSAGTLTSRTSTDSTQLQQLLGLEMSMALISVFNLLGCIAIAFVYGWKLSLIGLFAVLPIILAAGYFRVKLELQFEKLNAAVFAESSQFATESIGSFRTVVSLIMEDVISDRYEHLLGGHVLAAVKKAWFSTVVFAFSNSIELLCISLCFWYGGRLLASHEYDLVQFFVPYMAIVYGSQAAGTWFSFAPNIAEATAAANRILSLRLTDDDEPKGAEAMSQHDGPIGVDFQDVSFTYKSRGIPVLKGLDMKILPGQFAALVGASGCGKSTVVSLLERFYDPDSGVIACNDQDLQKLNLKEYRNGVSLVAQESTLYDGTVKENITMSIDESLATDEVIHKACSDAQIHDFIISLPEGYSTRLGSKGVTLSGGQRQRLALARALIRNPRLLLLDEATSSLDSTSEAEVQKAIERTAERGNQTIIAVAHRLATIQKADIIFVLGSGKVLEKGTHQSLLNARGVYYEMCMGQALDR